jgi:hypothetical protein
VAEPLRARLLVLDTGPLITLAAADSLDYLLYPGVPVFVPDAVFHEATARVDALGAGSIAAWAQLHLEAVRLVPTQAYADLMALRTLDPGRRIRDLGERAALEAIRDAIVLGPQERAVLLTEDDRVVRGTAIIAPEDRERVIPMTTRDFLLALELAGRINSAEAVYARAEAAGRTVSRRTVLEEQAKPARDAVSTLLARRNPAP